MTKQPKRVRLTIELSQAALRQLILWSASRSENKGTWARTVLVLRCSENEPKVIEWLEKQAANVGTTREEIEKAILEREGFDVAAYRAELLGTDSDED